jgi:hypothetical protein
MLDTPQVLTSMIAKCNICGAELAPATTSNPMKRDFDREAIDCATCKSSVRVRSLIALLSQEIFGVMLALPEFPVLKGIRGIGMSDSPQLAERLAEKFDYTNTFYHQWPKFDVTQPETGDIGRYDFMLSSEVMEHVPPPIERAFETLLGVLKADGLLLMTTPYTIGGKTTEHFPELHEYTLAEIGGRPVLVNRRRDGRLETFDELTFHGGHGSTVEMRTFTDQSLRQALLNTGFKDVHFFARNIPEFGIEHSSAWSLPISARKGRFQAPVAELAREYREACRLAERKIRDLALLTGEYERHVAFHRHSQRLLEEWAHKLEAEFEERTVWNKKLELERAEALADYANLEAVEKELRQRITGLEQDLEELRSARWTKVGRGLGLIKKQD